MRLIITTKYDNEIGKLVSSCFNSETYIKSEIDLVRYELNNQPIINGVKYIVTRVKKDISGKEQYVLENYTDWLNSMAIRSLTDGITI